MADRTSLWKLVQFSLFLGIAVICLVIFAHSEVSGQTKPHRLTCKYFDGLMKNHDECIMVHPGRKVSVTPEGLYKDLYKEVFLFLSEKEDYRRSINGKSGVIKFESYTVDLNNDSKEEVILIPLTWHGENTTVYGDQLRGNHSGDIFIFQERKFGKSSKWQCIGEPGGSLLRIEPRKDNGYSNIIVQVHPVMLIRYTYNPSHGQYKVSEEKRVTCHIRSERPCYDWSRPRNPR